MDTEEADSDNPMAEVLEQSEQRMVRFNVALVGHNRAEKLALLQVTESASEVGAVVEQYGHDAVSRLRQGLEKAYSTVRMPCPVTLTRVSRIAATSIRRKGERSRYDGELEPAEGRPTETWQGSARATRSRGSGKSRGSRR